MSNRSKEASLVDHLVGAGEHKLGGTSRPSVLAVRHDVFEMVMARVSAIACGHEDAIDLDRLRHDPLMKVAVGRCPITGAPLQLKKDGGLRPHHPLYRRAAAATERQVHLTYGVGVEGVTRAPGIPAEVSKTAKALGLAVPPDAAIETIGLPSAASRHRGCSR